MGVIQDLLAGVPLPRLVPVRQRFPATEVPDLERAVRDELGRPGVGDTVRPGASIAVAVGSRGIAELPRVVAALVAGLRARGAVPFLVPAMGSHGGATAEGQVAVLARLGVTEASAGCPIRATMEVVEVGRLDNGLPVLVDRLAHEADGIVVVNRVKPHNAFRGPNESGLAKMIAIGLGKQRGADEYHVLGFGPMPGHIAAAAAVSVARTRILFGLALVENAYDRPALVEAVPAAAIVARDRELLAIARASMPRLLLDPLDVLVVDRVGKEFSGGGMDGNVTGRFSTPFASGGARVGKLVALDLSEATAGNGNGVGLADFTTRRLVSRLDYVAMYANALTSRVTTSVRIPAALDTDREAIQAAVKTCGVRDLPRVRLVRIPDTLHLGQVRISEALLDEARAHPALEIAGPAAEMAFGPDGRLLD
ncbi:MAG: DUF2088 domain-containing protein [Deltaproteobacteria bacterium]|nr:DUF2088 domain-containing protein [Deltaproteobacteria bacterium]